MLTIYKASAGSGKTSKITEEYLAIVLKNPGSFRHILGITFTNKAAAEMKNRIIEELAEIAKGEHTRMGVNIQAKLNIEYSKLVLNAQKALKSIIYDYSRFSLGTIDSFFQNVIRAFAKETGLQAGYNIELDSQKVTQHAIDKTLNDIQDNLQLREWLIDFSINLINNGKSWNPKANLEKLASELHKEIVKNLPGSFWEKLNNKDFIKKYLSNLHSIITEFEKEMSEIGQNAINTFEKAGLKVKDFPHGNSGFASYFIKIQNANFEVTARVVEALENPEKWYKQKDINLDKIKSVYPDLNKLLNQAVSLYNSKYEFYNSAKLILSNFYTLGVLNDISENIRQYSIDNNTYLLSDAVQFLRKIIGENDTPYIYEKIGNSYQTLLLDEFQDTSELQWNNLKPLVINSLSDNKSFIVGDVKQSIYRWRNGDWTLLAYKVKEQLAGFTIADEVLNNNWRSLPNIIAFNNSLFGSAPGLLQQIFNSECTQPELLGKLDGMMTDAYFDHFQLVSKSREKGTGYVRFNFVKKDNENLYKEFVLNELYENIKKVQDKGYRLSDIVVLTRSNEEGKVIADFLIEKDSESTDKYRFSVISEESLFISGSRVVHFLLVVLRLSVNPNELMYRYNMLNDYMLYIYSSGEIKQNIQNPELLKNTDLFLVFFPPDFSKLFKNIQFYQAFELAEELIRVFNLKRFSQDLSHLSSFLDVIHDYSATQKTDVSSFVAWWDDFGYKQTVSFNDKQDAIRVMTIHKSKGLQFEVVFIPFCNWKIAPKSGTILWSRPEEAPYNDIDILPVEFGKKLKDSIFKKDYYYEMFLNFVDNLNILYVAFTRAKSVFIAWGSERGKSVTKISDLVFDAIVESNDLGSNYLSLKEFWSESDYVLTIGEIRGHDFTLEDNNRFDCKTSVLGGNINRFKLSCHSIRDRIFDENESLQMLQLGTVLHKMFSEIQTIPDFNNVIIKYQKQGLLSEPEIQDITVKWNDALQNNQIKSWFSTSQKALNERDLLLPEGDIIRPDRVIIENKKVICIDFKFGHEENEKYIYQVKKYMHWLNEMGYENIEGYLWYFSLNKIEKC